jgi:hypothetical protein
MSDEFDNSAVELDDTTRPRCHTCPFWEALSDHHDDYGGCRISPPQSREVGQAPSCWWPVTERYAWCAQHPEMPIWLKDQYAKKYPPQQQQQGQILRPMMVPRGPIK